MVNIYINTDIDTDMDISININNNNINYYKIFVKIVVFYYKTEFLILKKSFNLLYKLI